ncbi:MAG: hypothetical protein AAFR47_08895 [Pseudomonadota bacterium]
MSMRVGGQKLAQAVHSFVGGALLSRVELSQERLVLWIGATWPAQANFRNRMQEHEFGGAFSRYLASIAKGGLGLRRPVEWHDDPPFRFRFLSDFARHDEHRAGERIRDITGRAPEGETFSPSGRAAPDNNQVYLAFVGFLSDGMASRSARDDRVHVRRELRILR